MFFLEQHLLGVDFRKNCKTLNLSDEFCIVFACCKDAKIMPIFPSPRSDLNLWPNGGQ